MEFEVPVVPVPAGGNQPAVPTGDPLYERQASLGLSQPTVSIIGCGGVGCWVALSLVLGGVKELHLYDGDTLSLHNLNRFPLPPSANGEMKSVALATWLSTLRPDADIRARGLFIEGVHSLATNWVVCATDSLKSRVFIHQHAVKQGIRYLEVGADGERWGMSPAPPEFQTELEDQTGYQTVPVHVGPCMMAGAAAAYYVLHDTVLRDSFMVDWDKGPELRYQAHLGSLKFNKMAENPLDLSGIEFLTCPVCSRQVEVNVIGVIRHLREERRLGLAEAKLLAESMIAKHHIDSQPQIAQELAEVNATQDEVIQEEEHRDDEHWDADLEADLDEALDEDEEARETEDEQTF